MLVLATAVAALFAAGPAATAATSVDLTTNIAGPTASALGATFTYTATFGNNTLPEAGGATFTITVPSRATGVSATCAATNGAACPASMTTTDAAVSGTIPTLPHLGLVTVKVTGVFGDGTPSTVTATSRIDPPPGTTDLDPSSNTSNVNTSISTSADLSLTITQSTTAMTPTTPNTYTATFTNKGDARADGAKFTLYYVWDGAGFSTVNTTVVSCTATGGTSCPSQIADASRDANQALWTGSFTSFPAGATVKVVFTARPVFTCGSTNLQLNGLITPPPGISDPSTADQSASQRATATGPACATTKLTATKVQRVTGGGSASLTPSQKAVNYTVTYKNEGPNDASGAAITDTAEWPGAILGDTVRLIITGCTPTTLCPESLRLASRTITNTNPADPLTRGNVWSEKMGSFPSGASIVITYSLTASNFTGCGTGSFDNSATLTPPAGLQNSADASAKTGTVKTPIEGAACPPADLTVTRSQSSSVLTSSDAPVHTVTFTNKGPGAADGATVAEALSWNDSSVNRANVTIVSCTGTGGVSCPSTIVSRTVANYGAPFTGTLDSFPSQAKLTIVYSIMPTMTTCGGTTTFTAKDTIATPAAVTDPDQSNNSVTGSMTLLCADVAINKTVTPGEARAGQAVSFTITITNSSPSSVSNVVFSDPLPLGFVYGSAVCTPSSAASTCGTMKYDAGTRTVSSTVTRLGSALGAVTIVIAGKAGTVQANYRNTATAMPGTGASAFFDPNLASNTSSVSLQVYNSTSTFTIAKQLEGISSGGLPVPLTFTGSIVCLDQGTTNWTVTIPAGMVRATTSPAIQIWDGDNCTVTEAASPPAPLGLHFVGSASIDRSAFATVGPSATYLVTSTSVLNGLVLPFTGSVIDAGALSGVGAVLLLAAAAAMVIVRRRRATRG